MTVKRLANNLQLGERPVGFVKNSRGSLAPEHGIIDTKLKWAVAGLAVILVVVLGVQMVHRAAFSTELNSDFTTYRAAGWIAVRYNTRGRPDLAETIKSFS